MSKTKLDAYFAFISNSNLAWSKNPFHTSAQIAELIDLETSRVNGEKSGKQNSARLRSAAQRRLTHLYAVLKNVLEAERLRKEAIKY